MKDLNIDFWDCFDKFNLNLESVRILTGVPQLNYRDSIRDAKEVPFFMRLCEVLKEVYNKDLPYAYSWFNAAHAAYVFTPMQLLILEKKDRCGLIQRLTRELQ